jgi:PBP1b-binding outer membrane lipoprotein LpoB
MSRIALIVAAAAALLLAGCATNYEHYAKAIEAQAKYHAVAQPASSSAAAAATIRAMRLIG